ncbi:MAG: hypothetical protein WC548_04705 [Candidatus Pacearchaeota archaeon]
MGAMTFFIPIFAFLLIFIIIYALLKKTEILGGSEPIILFVSFVLAIFFIFEASLVELVRFSSAWVTVVVMVVFFLIAIIGFLPGKEPLGFLTKGNWLAWAVLIIIVGIFIFSSVYVFNWVINWELINSWFGTEWVGMILLILIALVISYIITKKGK